MIDKYVLATNDDGDLAIRTVSATESSSVTDTTSVITATDDGKLAVRVVGAGGGGGGGDSHNKGSFLTPEALRTAYPTAEPGDFAIVESTDTVWVWDSDGSDWKDGDTKGQVTSVNNQTGAVTLGINDVAPTQTGKSGYVLGTDGFVAGWVEPEIVQRSTMPVASQDEEGNIYQFIGTTDANYTHGYFYECVSDGGNPATYSWTQTDVQPQAGGLPSQTGNAGKFLTTDGTDASWSDKPLVNTFSDSTSLGILSYENRAYPRNVIIGTNIRYEASLVNLGDSVWIGDSVNHPSSASYWQAANSVIIGSKAAAQEDAVVVGYNARGGANYYAAGSVCIGYQAGTNGGSSQVAVGYNSKAGYYSVAIGREANANYSSTYLGAYTIAIGSYASAKAAGAIQIGKGTNSTGGTLQIGLSTGGEYGTTNQYVLLGTDGTIPTDRYTTTPVADGTYVPTLTISSGVATRTWGAAASAPVVPSTMPTLAVADWSSNTQTITVTGVTASNVVIVAPAPASAADYAAAGIVCTAQGSGTLTFTCTTVPSNAITVNVVILG